MRYGLILLLLLAGCAADNCLKCDKNPCDTNRDGKVTAADGQFDFNGDGTIGGDDFSHFQAVCG